MQYQYPLLQLVPSRIRHLQDRVKKEIWPLVTPLAVFMAEGFGQTVEDTCALSFSAVDQGCYYASPGWTHKWFRLEIPEALPEEQGNRYLYWNAQGETTVYRNGQPWSGLDIAHPWCRLPDAGGTLYLECGSYQTAVWTLRADEELSEPDQYGLRFHGADIRIRDQKSWEAYHDLEVLIQLMDYHLEQEGIGLLDKGRKAPLENCSPLLRKLIRRLDETADLFDAGRKEEFQKALKQIYRDFPAENWAMAMSVAGNSHIDLVWMWPEEITWKKAVHTLASMIRLSEDYPEMVFTMSQPPLLEEIRRRAPELYEQVKLRFDRGQWEATGVMQVESDTQLPCGEGLVRSLTIGQKSFRALTGGEGETLWLPDAFGYSSCLPQLCALSGVKNFFTTKMTWSEVNRFPHNSFVWESPDGSSVTAHLTECGYVSPLSVKQVMESARTYRQSDVQDEFLIAVGHGDGGGGVTEGQCERLNRMENLATLPRAKWSGGDEFFKGLRKVREKLPVYRGELYLEYHRGTYTTQGHFKQVFRACEKAMQRYEAACVLKGQPSQSEDIWKRLIFSQFHDAIPGSALMEVYDQLGPELETLTAQLDGMTASLLEDGNEALPLGCFNPLGEEGKWLLEIPETEWEQNFPGTDPAQISSDGNALFPIVLPGMGTTEIRPSEHAGSSVPRDVTADLNSLSNGLCRAIFDKGGHLTALHAEGKELELDGPCRLLLHEDHPVHFEAWDIDRNALWLGKEIPPPEKKEILEAGPLRAVLRVSGRMGEKSSYTLDYILEKGSPWLKMRLSADWQEKEKLLRFEVPTRYRGQDALYGAPFGSIKRSQNTRSSQDAAMWEVPASRWMAVTNDSGEGLGIVTEAKYGFGCRNGIAGISLIRSPESPDNDSIFKKVLYTDQGQHEIQWALSAHSAQKGENQTAGAAETLFAPPIICRTKNEAPLFHIENQGGLSVSWIKPGEIPASYIIRLHETLGRSGTAVLHLENPPEQVFAGNLKEEKQEQLEKCGDLSWSIPYTPYQIKTLVVYTG